MAGYRISMGGWAYKPTDEIIHSADSPDRQVHGAKLDMAMDGISKLTFTMPPTHPLAGSIELLRYGSTTKSISLYFDDQQLFHGVVVSKSEDMDGEITVTCKDDGVMLEQAYVSLISSDTHNRDTAENVIRDILDEYNALVPNDLHVGIGNVPTVGYDDGSRTVVDMPASGKAMTALDAIRSCVEPYGCTLRVTPHVGTTMQYAELNVYDGAHGSSSQVVRFGENLVDYTSEVFEDGVYTAVMPVGRNYNHRYYYGYPATFRTNRASNAGSKYLYGSNVSGQGIYQGFIVVIGEEYTEYKIAEYESGMITLDSPLDVYVGSGTDVSIWPNYSGVYKFSRPRMLDSLPDGTYKSGQYQKTGKTLYNINAVQRYGLRTLMLNMSDEGHSDVLLNRAIEALDGNPTIPLLIEIDAIDMALYTDSVDHLTAGQTLRVVSEPHGVDTTMAVSDIRLNLDDPSQTRYTLGVRPDTISGKVEQNRLGMSILDDDIMYRIRTI